MSATLVQVSGLKEMVAYFKGVGEVEMPAKIKATNLLVAAEIAAEMRDHAPVGTAAERDKHPGALRASIRGMATARRAYITIGSGLDYAKPIIFGWPKHHIRRDPFPYETLGYQRANIAARYTAALAEALGKGSKPV